MDHTLAEPDNIDLTVTAFKKLGKKEDGIVPVVWKFT